MSAESFGNIIAQNWAECCYGASETIKANILLGLKIYGSLEASDCKVHELKVKYPKIKFSPVKTVFSKSPTNHLKLKLYTQQKQDGIIILSVKKVIKNA